MKANNVIMEVETYESPECQVINLECEYAILVGSGTSFGSSTHEEFTEENYDW